MEPVFGKMMVISDIDSFENFIKDIGKQIETQNIDKNQHMKALLQESKQDLIDMMDESYQDAFNIEIKKGK